MFRKKRETLSFRDQFVHFQVFWTKDLNVALKRKKAILKEIRGKLAELGVDKNDIGILGRVFYLMYVYMLSEEQKILTTSFKNCVFIAKVDIFENNLICVVVSDLDKHYSKIMDVLGEKVPRVTDYNSIYKVVFRYETKGLARNFLVFLIFFGVLWMGYKYFLPLIKTKKRAVVYNGTQTAVRVVFSSEEQKEAYGVVFMKCLDKYKEMLVRFKEGGHVRVEGARIKGEASDQRVSCMLAFDLVFDYPARDTIRTGEGLYRKQEVVDISLNRENFLKEGGVRFPRYGDFMKCLRVVRDGLSGEVMIRKGGVVVIEGRRGLSAKQAFYLGEFLKEVMNVCGWDVVKVKEASLNVGEGDIDLQTNLEIYEGGMN